MKISSEYDDVVMDFALSVGLMAISDPLSIKRTPSLPLSSCHPAGLIGLRATCRTEDGDRISEAEFTALENLAAVHFQPIHSALKLSDGQGVVPRWATIMGTFLKKGFVHLIAFRCLGGDTTPLIDVEIIDSLPVRCSINSFSELAGRMRLVIALFTLRNHVARFATRWSDIHMDAASLGEVHSIMVDLGSCRSADDTATPGKS